MDYRSLVALASADRRAVTPDSRRTPSDGRPCSQGLAACRGARRIEGQVLDHSWEIEDGTDPPA